MVGPAGTGKSRACLEKLLAVGLRTPGVKMLALRKTLVSLTATGLRTWEEHVAKEALAAKTIRWYGGSQREPAQYKFSNGSVLVVGGMDDPTKIMSSEYDIIYVQEATELTPNEWEMCTSRLRNYRISFQQLLADCNPHGPTHWLKQRIDTGLTFGLPSRHQDNPVFWRAGDWTEAGRSYVLGTLANLTGVRRARLYLGLWAAADGIIYEQWDDTLHYIGRGHPLLVVDRETRVCSAGLPWDWPRYYALDFGFTNPMVVQRWAEDHDGRLYLYGEQYLTQQTVKEHALDLLDIVRPVRDGARQWSEPAPKLVVVDHDAEGRAVFTGTSGLGTTKADKRVRIGIEAVQSRLKIANDGLPRLMIVRDGLARRDQSLVDAKKPTCTYEEISGYIWDKPLERAKNQSTEQPVKKDDHGMDAMRYLVMNRDPAATSFVRVMHV
jgi:terminase large subunit-like protein